MSTRQKINTTTETHNDIAEADGILKLLEQVPYSEKGMGFRKVVDHKHVQVMQIALQPGQRVPDHNANSNVHILVLQGEVVFNLADQDFTVRQGCMLPVAFETPMRIRNAGQENATFIVIKTPNPSEM